MGACCSSPSGAAWSAGAPTAAIVEPGKCVFGEDWTPAKLLTKISISEDTRIFSFGLSDASKPLGLSTCACLLAKGGEDADGNPIVRPYTPVSTNAMVGKFELMVKIYRDGKFSRHLDTLTEGQTVDFKHISKNVKRQYPFGKKKIGMFVGGTGITPMIQALHAILGTAGDTTTVSILYGSQTSDNILAKETMDKWCSTHAARLTVTHVLSAEPHDSAWAGPRGFINQDLITKYMPGKEDDCLLFVCGPPPMYNALCGPREEESLTGLLSEMGYSADQVYKF